VSSASANAGSAATARSSGRKKSLNFGCFIARSRCAAQAAY
jgi:hypothetical protein